MLPIKSKSVHIITEQGFNSALEEIKKLKDLAEDKKLTYSFTRNNCHIFFRHIQDIATEGAVPNIHNPRAYGEKGPHQVILKPRPFEPDSPFNIQP